MKPPQTPEESYQAALRAYRRALKRLREAKAMRPQLPTPTELKQARDERILALTNEAMMPPEDIAAAMDVPPSIVHFVLKRAREEAAWEAEQAEWRAERVEHERLRSLCHHGFEEEGWTVDPETMQCRVCGYEIQYWTQLPPGYPAVPPDGPQGAWGSSDTA